MKEQAKSKYEQFHIRTYTELLTWFRKEAKKNKRSTRAEIELAMEAYRNSKEISKADVKRLLKE
jgi:hypothetical protein